MPTRVFLLRHGETADPMIFHGAESDVGLSERGRRQAEAAAAALAPFAPTQVTSSAMLRARDTAEPIARACGLTLRIEPALHERAVGALSGTPTHGSDGVWPDTLQRWITGDTGYAPPGAESFDAIRERVCPIWDRLTAERTGQTQVIVAHGVVCRVLLVTILPGLSVADWRRLGPVPNVGITELVWQGEWRAVRMSVPPAELAPD
ncbi:MAG TPA: histidine phosphatase family protein [Gemmataceae bacterium]|nr:histidine phosphatase family protein [Gemmataceae bacterium]